MKTKNIATFYAILAAALYAINIPGKSLQSRITLACYTIHYRLHTLRYERVILLGSATQISPLFTGRIDKNIHSIKQLSYPT